MTGLSPQDERTVRRLMDAQHALSRRLDRAERSHDAQRTAIDAGQGIVVKDETGQPVYQVGRDAEGIVAPEYLDGPEPNVPEAPVVVAENGASRVSMSGMDVDGNPAPRDFRTVTVHASTEPDFEPNGGTVVGSSSRSAGTVTAVVMAGIWFFRIVWTTLSGKVSLPSAPVEVDVEPLVDLADLDAAVQQMGVREGTEVPTEEAPEGVIYYQRVTMPDGEAIAIYQMTDGQWIQVPLEDLVARKITTDQLVSGMGLIGGVLMEDGFLTARHATADSFLGNTFRGVQMIASQFQTHEETDQGAVLDAQGLRVYQSEEQADGTISSWPAVEMGINGESAFSTRDPATGDVLAEIGQEGSIGAVAMSVQTDPVFMGQAMMGARAEWIPPIVEGVGDGSWGENLGQRLVAEHYRDMSGFASSREEIGLAEVAFTMEPNHVYKVSFTPFSAAANGTGVLGRLRHRTGASCTLASPVLDQFASGAPGGYQQISGETFITNGPTRSQRFVMFSIASDASWSITGIGLGRIRLYVEDMGLATGGGWDRNANGPVIGDPAPPPVETPPITVSNYSSVWYPDWQRSWYNGGFSVQVTGQGSDMPKQGVDPGWPSGGAQTSMWAYTSGADSGDNIGQVISTALSGATLTAAGVYFKIAYGYTGSSVRLHWHGHSSAPGTYQNSADAINYIGTYKVPVGGSLSVWLPSSVRTAIKNGSFRGFSLNPRGSGSRAYAVGLAYPGQPSLTLRYRK